MELTREVLILEKPSTQLRAAMATKMTANIFQIYLGNCQVRYEWFFKRGFTWWFFRADISKWDDNVMYSSGCTWIFGDKFQTKIFRSQLAFSGFIRFTKKLSEMIRISTTACVVNIQGLFPFWWIPGIHRLFYLISVLKERKIFLPRRIRILSLE